MRRFLPSPALVVACLALVLAAGGASYAATRIGTDQLARDAVVSVKVKNGTLQKVDLSPEAISALKVKAFASVVVSPRLALENSRSRGFAKVTRPDPGVYCLTLTDPDLDPARTAPIVTVDWDNSSGANLTAYISKTAFGCPDSADIGVRTFTFKAGKPFRPANTVAFTLLVP